MRRLVVNTLFQEMMDHHNQKDGFRKHENWTRIENYDQLSILQTRNRDQNLVSE